MRGKDKVVIITGAGGGIGIPPAGGNASLSAADAARYRDMQALVEARAVFASAPIRDTRQRLCRRHGAEAKSRHG